MEDEKKPVEAEPVLENPKSKKRLYEIVAAVFLLIVAVVVVVFAINNNTESSNSASDQTEYAQLDDDMVDEKLLQEAAIELTGIDTAGLSEDELYDHYITIAGSFVASTDYDLAIAAYLSALEVRQSEYALHIAIAETNVLKGDADGAKSSYNDAIELFKASGAEGGEQFEEYIMIQIDNVDSAIESGYGSVFDGRSIDD